MKVDVSECIVDLLHNGSKVNLPGIGGLYVKNSSASIKNDQIYPPYRNIIFTEEEFDSTDLVDIIKRRYKVTQGTAANVVKKFSQILINKLVNFNSVRIPNLGSFSNSDKAKFTFTEERNSINAGKEILPVFTLNKIAAVTPASSIKTVQDKATSGLASAIALKSTVDTQDRSSIKPAPAQAKTSPVYNTYHEEESWWRTYLWPILILLLLGLLLMLGFKKCNSWLNNQSGTGDGTENTDTNSDQGGGTNDSLTSGTNTDGSNSDGVNGAGVIEYDLSDLENIPESVFANGCTIIVGSFGKSRNALNMIARLKRMGYNTYKEVNDLGLTRVGIEIDCNPDNFESIVQKIRTEVEPTSWSLIPRIKVEY